MNNTFQLIKTLVLNATNSLQAPFPSSVIDLMHLNSLPYRQFMVKGGKHWSFLILLRGVLGTGSV